MAILGLLLVLVSGLFAINGLVNLTQATLGVGSMAAACYVAILARMAQASGHLDATKGWQSKLKVTKAAAPGRTTADNGVPLVAITSSQVQCMKCGTVSHKGPWTCPQCGSKYSEQ